MKDKTLNYYIMMLIGIVMLAGIGMSTAGKDKSVHKGMLTRLVEQTEAQIKANKKYQEKLEKQRKELKQINRHLEKVEKEHGVKFQFERGQNGEKVLSIEK